MRTVHQSMQDVQKGTLFIAPRSCRLKSDNTAKTIIIMGWILFMFEICGGETQIQI